MRSPDSEFLIEKKIIRDLPSGYDKRELLDKKKEIMKRKIYF